MGVNSRKFIGEQGPNLTIKSPVFIKKVLRVSKRGSAQWLPYYVTACIVADLFECLAYNPSVHPGITHVFQSAAMRWGHTLVPPGVYRRTGYDEK